MAGLPGRHRPGQTTRRTWAWHDPALHRAEGRSSNTINFSLPYNNHVQDTHGPGSSTRAFTSAPPTRLGFVDVGNNRSQGELHGRTGATPITSRIYQIASTNLYAGPFPLRARWSPFLAAPRSRSTMSFGIADHHRRHQQHPADERGEGRPCPTATARTTAATSSTTTTTAPCSTATPRPTRVSRLASERLPVPVLDESPLLEQDVRFNAARS